MMIRRLSEVTRADLSTAGGKGANLGELSRLGLAVPPGFVVSTEAYAAQARAWGLAERLAPHLAANNWDAAAAEAAQLFESGALLPSIESAVREAYRELDAPHVAVRSSATAEDLADASFAGQHETFLNIAGEDEVLTALRRCWASLFSPRALGYRAARGVDHLGVDIAVVVQRMVPSEFAGVLFTVDPVAQRADRMLLEVAPGLGEAIVSGHTTGDVYRLRRPPFADAKGGSGEPNGASLPGATDLAIEDRDRRDPDRPAPSDAHVLELARLGLRLEAHFGSPQDVEFAIAGGSIYLLQSRPITTLGADEIEPLPPTPKLNFLQRKMAAANNNDRFPIAPKPIDQWSFRVTLPALAHAVRFMGLDVDDAELRASMDLVWRELMVLPGLRPSLRLLALPQKVAAGARRDWMAWWEGEAFKRITEVSAPFDLRAADDADLLRRADLLGDTTSELLGKRFEGMTFNFIQLPLRIAVTAAVGKKRADEVMVALLSGVPTRTSEVNLAIYNLARRAASAGPEVAGAIREGKPEDLRASEAGRAYLAEVDAFLTEHGHRESAGFYLSAPTWQQDPTPVWAILRVLLDAPDPPSEEGGYKRYQAALEEVRQKLRFAPPLLAAFERGVDLLRKGIVFRERSHYDFVRMFSATQAIVAEIARRLHERGRLPSPDDIVYLTEAELRGWLTGEAPPLDEAKKIIRRRRATYGVVNGRWQRRASGAANAGGSGSELRGAAASSGVVRGRARIVRDESEFGRLKRGEILVCHYTNPAWTPLFTLAAGVVTDTGGAVSHAAIVAREYGLPAVLGALGATERITDGQEIIVDGTEGRVTLLGKGGAAEAFSG